MILAELAEAELPFCVFPLLILIVYPRLNKLVSKAFVKA
jgi:hypothetical protein